MIGCQNDGHDHPFPQVPSPRQGLGATSSRSAFGSSLSSAAGNGTQGEGNWPMPDFARILNAAVGRHNAVALGRPDGSPLQPGDLQCNGVSIIGGIIGGVLPNGLRSSSLSPARPFGGSAGSIRRCSEGIPPRPPSKLGLVDLAAGVPRSPQQLLTLANGRASAGAGPFAEHRAQLQLAAEGTLGAGGSGGGLHAAGSGNNISVAGSVAGYGGSSQNGIQNGRMQLDDSGNQNGIQNGRMHLDDSGNQNGSMRLHDSCSKGLYPLGSVPLGPGTPPSLHNHSPADCRDNISPLSSDGLTADGSRP